MSQVQRNVINIGFEGISIGSQKNDITCRIAGSPLMHEQEGQEGSDGKREP